ncbi:hypothetical protein K449DRAFT_19066 [Hypoxylon sp. EC38]|nr:hypothetical protein K449DRAFT_19066 [Hypoxylon sp. EC38]
MYSLKDFVTRIVISNKIYNSLLLSIGDIYLRQSREASPQIYHYQDPIFTMYETQRVSFDILLEIVKYAEPEDRTCLALARMELYSAIYPDILQHALFDLYNADALRPLRYAVRTGNLPMLSMIYNLIKSDTRKWHCHKCTRDWNWYLGHYYSLDLFELAMCNSSKSFEFLIDTMEDSGMVNLKGEEGYQRGCHWATTPEELLGRAVWLDKLDCVRIILDRQHLFGLANESMPCSLHYEATGLHDKISAPVAEYLIDRGIKFSSHSLVHMCMGGFDGYFNADLARVLVNKLGLEVDYVSDYYFFRRTALSWACEYPCPAAVEALLELGANPNGVKGMMRPIDQLLASQAWKNNWPKVATTMYRCFKALIEHGAAITREPGKGEGIHPIQKLLHCIWRVLCPCARVAARAGKGRRVTIERLLNALLKVDIEPFDKLCDVVVDANQEYAAKAKGLRGKQRLVKLLRGEQNLPVKFEWNPFDLSAFDRQEFGVHDFDEIRISYLGGGRKKTFYLFPSNFYDVEYSLWSHEPPTFVEGCDKGRLKDTYTFN